MGKTLYKIKGLKRSFGQGESRVDVLKGIDLKIKKGEIVTILGPSGSGKSTLLNIIGGLDIADSGEIIYKNSEIGEMKKKDRILYRRKEIGFIFQFYNLLSNLTAKENIESCKYLSEESLEMEDILDTLNLTEHQNKFPNQLSGGQQQRVAFARALIKKPAVLLCDEPTGALDYQMSKEILKLLEKINDKYKTTIVIVTHNESIKNMSHHVIKMSDGKIVKDYKNDNLMSAEEICW